MHALLNRGGSVHRRTSHRQGRLGLQDFIHNGVYVLRFHFVDVFCVVHDRQLIEGHVVAGHLFEPVLLLFQRGEHIILGDVFVSIQLGVTDWVPQIVQVLQDD